jgi:RNA polymerase sigma-70 factor (ECF subfamily)
MHTTSVSLLERLRYDAADEAWTRFVELYTPLMYHWARGMDLNGHDAADLVQDVFATLVKKLPEFQYDRAKNFRHWLHRVTVNKWRERCRRCTLPMADAGTDVMTNVAVPDELPAFDEAEYRQYLVRRALELMQAEFHPTTWKACWEHTVGDRSAAEVAAELGISVGAVYVAKHRVLRRLRQELAGLLE